MVHRSGLTLSSRFNDLQLVTGTYARAPMRHRPERYEDKRATKKSGFRPMPTRLEPAMHLSFRRKPAILGNLRRYRCVDEFTNSSASDAFHLTKTHQLPLEVQVHNRL